MKNHTAMESLQNASNGVIHVVKTQKNMQRCIILSIAVIVTGIVLGLNAVELAVLCVPVTFLLLAEMLNTAAEVGMDFASGRSYHPLVKIIKDITAGSVLVALTGLGIVSLIIFADYLPSSVTAAIAGSKACMKYIIPPSVIAVCGSVFVIALRKRRK